MQQVKSYFDTNYSQYQNKFSWCQPRVTNTTVEMMKHIYGWVPFNEGCKDPALNALKDTPGYLQTHDTYRKLEYSPDGRYNPYVKLIHDKKFLDMGAYAFSIDDAVGNMQELGNGLAVAIGGAKGLPNPKPYDPSKSLIISMGTQPGGVKWLGYGACKPEVNPCKTDVKIPPNVLGFKLGTVTYPINAVITDNQNNTYQFTIAKAPPITKSDITNCMVNNQNSPWCVGLVVSTQIDKLTGHKVYYINTAPPVKK